MIQGDFYKGAYGPTILLVLQSVESAMWLRHTFEAQTERLDTWDLLESSQVTVTHLAGLHLETRASGPDLQLRADESTYGPAFVLSATRNGWKFVAGLMDPFCQAESGHQYLGGDDGDDAVIEISFGERNA